MAYMTVWPQVYATDIRLMFCVVILLAQYATICKTEDSVRIVVIRPDEVTYVYITPGEKTNFQLNDVRPDAGFVVFQVHSYKHPMILSLTRQPTHSTSVRGQDVGVVTILEKTYQLDWYLCAKQKKSSIPFRVLVLASVYDKRAPIPGGCNMEFSLKIDPNLHVIYKHAVNLVQFQYAQEGQTSSSCDVQLHLSLQYQIYQNYIEVGENNTFLGIEKMLTSGGMMKNAKRMHTFNAVDETEQGFAAFIGKGVVYNVIVTEHHKTRNNFSAAYIPVVCHSCHGNQVDCTNIDSYHAFALTVVILLSLIGLFLCFLGHRFFKTEMFIFGFLGLFIVCYVIIAKYTDLSLSLMVLVAMVAGIAGGMAWLMLWYYKGIPVVSVLMVGFVGGYLVASVVFNLTPLGGWHWWHVPLNYGLAFASAVLILPALLLAFTKTLNIVCCALVGSYLVVFAIDIFVQGNISQIVLLSIHKSVWDDVLKAVVSIPYQWSDFVLITMWLLLAIGGATVQFLRERHRAPFPPCPSQQQQLQFYQAIPSQPAVIIQPSAPPVNGHSYDADVEDDENEPLLQALRQMEYQTHNKGN